MAIIHKDIGLLSQKSAVAGTEKLPVSNTEYITPAQIAALVEGRFAIVDFDWEDPPTFSDISDLYEDGILPVIRRGSSFYFPNYIDSAAEECSFFNVGHGGLGDAGYNACLDFNGSEWSGVTKTIYSKPSGGIPASDLASGVIPDTSNLLPKSGGTMSDDATLEFADTSGDYTTSIEPGKVSIDNDDDGFHAVIDMTYDCNVAVENNNGSTRYSPAGISHTNANNDTYIYGFPSASGTLALTSQIPVIHSGTSDPSSSLGSNGDIYIKLSS